MASPGRETNNLPLRSVRLRDGWNEFLYKTEKAGQWLDTRPLLLAVVLLAAYAVVAIPHSCFQPMWHDELITYYLALSPSMGQMLREIPRIDLNPPALYILDYLTLHVPAAHANEHLASLLARLPSLLAGLLASFGLFSLIGRRIGFLYGMAAVSLLWKTEFLKYSWEDRPYALLCGFLVLLILVWERASQPKRHPLWIGAVFLVGFAMMGSHFFGSFLLLAFLAAEIARAWNARRFDLPLLTALILPFTVPLLYREVISSYTKASFPPSFHQPSIFGIGMLYASLLDSCLLCLIPILLMCLIMTIQPQGKDIRGSSANSVERSLPGFSLPEGVLFLFILVEPVLVTLALIRTHGAIFTRYGVPACISIAVLTTVFLFWRFDGLKRVALIVVIGCGVGPILAFAHRPVMYLTDYDAQAANSSTTGYRAVRPDLPLVDASALTFVEMNHRESPELLRRTYYLTDNVLALRYSNASLWQGEGDVSRILRFRGKVQDLSTFKAGHSEFLVLGTYDYPEDWLLRALVAEGDTVQYLGNFKTTYKDKDLYKVTIRAKP